MSSSCGTYYAQSCHSEERRISARNSTKIGDYACRATYGDSSFLRMTNNGVSVSEK